MVDVRTFDWTRTSGQGAWGSLAVAGSNPIVLTPCPSGITDVSVDVAYVYVSGGAGMAEAARITTLSPSLVGCTIAITTSNSHAGAWALSSATGGMQEALNAAEPWGVVNCPPATYSFFAPATVTSSNQTIFGDHGCVLKAADNAQLQNMLVVATPASGFHLMGTTWDGNRANGGSAQNGNDPTYALIAIRSSDSVISQAQIENGNAMGVLVDGDSQDPHNTRFLANYIHDNGGVVDAAGIGVGVRLGRTRCPDQTLFDGNHFERNYNTVGSIHFSNAINSACGTNTLVTGNSFKDNLNTLGGGQIYLADYNNTCTAEVSATITGNEFSQTLFGVLDDQSSGIELCGKGTVVSGNTVKGWSKYGIVIDGSVSDSRVADNQIVGTMGDGILVGGSHSNTVSGNTVVAPHGITWFDASTTFNTLVIDNNLLGSPKPFFGKFPAPDHGVSVINNLGYNPVGDFPDHTRSLVFSRFWLKSRHGNREDLETLRQKTKTVALPFTPAS